MCLVKEYFIKEWMLSTTICCCWSSDALNNKTSPNTVFVTYLESVIQQNNCFQEHLCMILSAWMLNTFLFQLDIYIVNLLKEKSIPRNWQVTKLPFSKYTSTYTYTYTWVRIFNFLRKILPNPKSSERDSIESISSNKFLFRNYQLWVS